MTSNDEREELRAEVQRLRTLCIPIADLMQELGIARQEVQRARAEGWQEGFDRAEHMAHCWGHTDHWGEEDPYPINPYGAALDGDA